MSQQQHQQEREQATSGLEVDYMADSKKYDGSQWEHSLRKLTTATEAVENPLYSDGTAITAYTLKGNEEHTGTPTPSNPVEVNGVGERTENLFDGQLQQGYYAYATGDYTLGDPYVCTHLIPCTENTTYTFRCINTGGGSKNYGYVFFDSAQNRIDSDYINVFTEGDVVTHTATTPQNTAFLAINIAYGRRQASVIRPSDITDFMLNTGSTAKPYEPYGFKIPISSANTTTPVYLGEVETTRKIYKWVLTGNEEGWFYSNGFVYNQSITPDYLRSAAQTVVCSHFKAIPNVTAGGNVGEGECALCSIVGIQRLYFRDSNYTTSVSDFKTYLQQQYSAGMPVTVWYVLATPTTGIVNEPIRKIGDYADTVSGITIPTITSKDTFDVLTTLKPSEVSLNYTGWHDASVKEKSENLFDKDNANTQNIYVYTDDTIVHDNQNTVSVVFPCQPSTTYTISKTISSRFAVGYTNAYPQNGTPAYSISADNTATNLSITTGSSAEYIVIFISYTPQETKTTQEIIDTIMINEGQTALPYEPYWK